MNKPEKNCSIPALKEDDGTWALTPLKKAELLAKTFAAKVVLPDFAVNEFALAHKSGNDGLMLPPPSSCSEENISRSS